MIEHVADFGEYGEENTGESEIFQVVEDMPSFPGGNVSKWIAKNVKYPVLAMENGIQGKVFIQFVIERDGSITDVKVVRGVDASLDKEAVRVVQSMPKWKPGKQRGKPVRVAYTLPINSSYRTISRLSIKFIKGCHLLSALSFVMKKVNAETAGLCFTLLQQPSNFIILYVLYGSGSRESDISRSSPSIGRDHLRADD